MALLWIEGFEGFGTTIDAIPSPAGIVARKYGAVTGEYAYLIQPGRVGGRSMQISSVILAFLMKTPVFDTTDPTMIIGFAFKMVNSPAFEHPLIDFLKDGSVGAYLSIMPDDTLRISNGGEIGRSTQTLNLSTWYYIEMKVVADASGSILLRVNGAEWINETGVDTRPGGTYTYQNKVTIRGPGYIHVSYDDLYILDGTAGLNDFLGPQRVVAINPDGDDTVTWDRSAEATNREVVDDGLLLDNTDYVSTDTTPEQDLYDYESVPSIVTVINGIQIMTETNMEDGTLDLAAVVKSDTTESVGPASPVIVGDDVTHVRVVEDDPDAVAPWTETTLNAAKFGIKATV